MRDGVFRVVEVTFPPTILGSASLPLWRELRRQYPMNYDVGPIWNQIDEMDFGIQHIAVPLEVVKSVCPVSAYKVRHMVTNPVGEASHEGDSFLVAREHLEHVLSGAFTIDQCTRYVAKTGSTKNSSSLLSEQAEIYVQR